MGNAMDTLLGDNPVTDKATERGTNADGSLLYAASCMKGWRNTMEDGHTLCTEIPVGENVVLKDHGIFAVYDGHGGNFTSMYSAENLVRIFSERTELKRYASLSKTGAKGRDDVNGIELLRLALLDTFCVLDDELREEQLERNRKLITAGISTDIKIERSGATCVVVLVTPSHILCANAGDSRAILRRKKRILPLSFDHKPGNLVEQERIMDASGFVRNKRINGDLAVSRGLGDFGFKNDDKLPPDRQQVVCTPEILVYPRESEGDEFIVLACDGVWDVVDNEQCGDLIQNMFDQGEGDVGLVCEEVLDMCLVRNSRDNMTIVVLCFAGVTMERNSLLMRNVVLTRRASRRAVAMGNDAKMAAQNAFGGVVDLGCKTNNVAPATPKPRVRAQ